MQQHVLKEIIRLSGNVIFEHVESDWYRPWGHLPGWMSEVNARRADDMIKLSDLFPQLVSVQVDLNLYWDSATTGLMDLGIWEVATTSQAAIHRLRVYATCVEDKRLFVLQDLNCGPLNTPQILQRARERELQAGEQIRHQNLLMEKMQSAKIMAEELSHKKNLFVADLSHELRTPLNVITCMLSLIKKTSQSPKDEGFLESAITAANNLARICSDLLDVSKIEAGRIEFVSQDICLRSIAHAVCETFRTASKRKGIELRCLVSHDTPTTVRGDEVRITQILNNLVGNAVKFTERGFVELSLRPHENCEQRICFSVQDTGIGIPNQKREAIFEEFVQLRPDVNASQEGSGLGLGIAQRLVDLMGGKIQVRSQESQGSDFSFSIDFQELSNRHGKEVPHPLQMDTGGDQFKSEPAGEPRDSFQGLNVLLAEDHPVNLKLVGEILGSHGFAVTSVDNGTEALSALQSAKFDVAILDWKMPAMNGTDVIRRVRETSECVNQGIPAIALTAFVREHDREKCLNAGFDVCLGKPFQLEHLVSTVKSLAR